MKPKQRARLKAAIKFSVEEAQRSASIAVSSAVAESVHFGGGRNSSTSKRLAKAVADSGDLLIKELMKIYSDERSKLFLDDFELKSEIILAINSYYQSAESFKGYKYLLNANEDIYSDIIADEWKRDIERIRHHFISPGIKPIVERFPILFGGLTGGGILLWILGRIFR